MAPPTSISQLKKAAAAAANPSPSSATSPSPSPSSAGISPSFSSSFSTLTNSYKTTTPSHIKLIDAFLLFLLVSGVAQFAYCVLVTSFPYNAFLGSFASSAGQFVLLAGLRAQVSPPLAVPSTLTSTSGSKMNVVTTEREFKEVSKERAFADFCFASVILHFFVFNFLG